MTLHDLSEGQRYALSLLEDVGSKGITNGLYFPKAVGVHLVEKGLATQEVSAFTVRLYITDKGRKLLVPPPLNAVQRDAMNQFRLVHPIFGARVAVSTSRHNKKGAIHHRTASVLERYGLIELVPGSNGVYRLTRAGLELLGMRDE